MVEVFYEVCFDAMIVVAASCEFLKISAESRT